MRILRSSIVLVKKDGNFLLGYNKRGFSQDKWTGFGGVVQQKEDLKMCALRNTKEQCGLTLEKLEKVGKIEVKFAGVQELVQMHIFVSDMFTGELKETKGENRDYSSTFSKVDLKEYLEIIREEVITNHVESSVWSEECVERVQEGRLGPRRNGTWKVVMNTRKNMKPGWFPGREIPYKNMWSDVIYWLPPIVEGKKIKGFFVYQNEALIYQDLNTDAFSNARFPRPRNHGNHVPARGILSR